MTGQILPISKFPNSKLHFIGIGGSGMAPLAELAFRSGFEVTGSDSSSSEVISYLKTLGIPISLGHSKKNLPKEPHFAIVKSSAIKDTNEELIEAQHRKLKTLHRSDLLHAFLSQTPEAITVAGTHGKSTTSAMLSFVLEQLGIHALSVVGAKFRNYETLALLGNGSISVAEADESDGSFLKYRPHVGVLTSIDFDHMDYYKNHDHIVQTYKTYLSNVQAGGCAVINADDPYALDLYQLLSTRKLSYGFHSIADLQGSNYTCVNGESFFDIQHKKKVYKARIKLIGPHNAQNALACIAATQAINLDIESVLEKISSFSGIKRRLELIYENPHLKIYDDYAHNPTKIRSVVYAVRQSYPQAQLIVFFQPHRYSRLKTMYNSFIGSFSEASHVVALPTYGSGEEDLNPVQPEQLIQDIQHASQTTCSYAASFEDAADMMKLLQTQETVVLTLGAGDVWQLALKLKENIK